MFSLSIKDITFAFLDVETTGLSPNCGDKICEIGVLRVRNGKRRRSFHSLVDPGREVSVGAYMVNGITKTMLKGKPRFSQIASCVLKMLDKAVIVCHNAPFDLGFL